MNVVFFGDHWDSRWRRRQQIAARMARWPSVESLVYFEVPLTAASLAKTVLSRHDTDSRARWRRVLRHGFKMRAEEVQIVTPFALSGVVPVGAVEKINDWLVARTGVGRLASPASSPELVWASVPGAVKWLHCFPEALVCYDCTERFSRFPWENKNRRKLLARWDNELAQRANLVFVQTEDHRQEKSCLNPATFVLPNAVEVSPLQDTERRQTPRDVQRVARPRIGYVGSINSRIDWQLVHYLATARSSWQFVFVGNGSPKDCGGGEVAALPNVHFLGEKPYALVPAYLYSFDVCTIPLKMDELTASQSPLKLFDYLASGRPIVSVPLDGLAEFTTVVYTAPDGEAFVDSIERALAEAPELSARRRRRAQENSWDVRVEQLRSILSRYLPAARRSA